jgi:opacity protein-like surface antigen
MKKVLASTAMAGLISAAFATSASAAQPYVGVGVGAFVIDTGLNRQDTFGGYLQLGDDFSQYVGGEIRVGASGKTKEEIVVTPLPASKVDWFAAAFLKPKYEFADNWMGYGLIGIATMRASYYPVGAVKQSKTRTGLGYGLGLQYRVSDQYSLGGEWSHLLSKPGAPSATVFQGAGVSMYTLSGKLHF